MYSTTSLLFIVILFSCKLSLSQDVSLHNHCGYKNVQSLTHIITVVTKPFPDFLVCRVTNNMGAIVRFFRFVILALRLYICYYCTTVTCAGSLLYYVLPTDHKNVSCPQNVCITLNEWIEGNELFMNETSDIKVVLLPGLHIVDTTRNMTVIRDIDSIVLTCANGRSAIVQYMNGFTFVFSDVEVIQISNVVFNSCGLVTFTMVFSGGRYIEVANITIEHGGIDIVKFYTNQ